MTSAFISYKSEYRDFARQVRDHLHTWGYGTWLDVDDIPASTYWRDEIDKGLKNTDVVIGVLTPEAIRSREVMFEWDHGIAESRLILLKLVPVENPHYHLRSIQHIDFTADVNEGFSRLQNALTDPTPDADARPSATYTRHRQTPETAYKPPAEKKPPKRRRFITGMLAIILLLVAGVIFFFGDRVVTLVLAAVALIPAVIALMPQPETLDFPVSQEEGDENRAKMLYNVYQTWIEGALRPNLPAGAIDLGLGLRPDAVLRHATYDDYNLPESAQSIGQIFTDMHGELVILGDPGGGKTILLLQLAEHLLGVAQADETQPVPAVFNLSSWSAGKWSAGKKPLDAWLVDELRRVYGVPKPTGERWVADGDLTLLLDGLDELAPSADMTPGATQAELDEAANELRSACIEAINAYRAAHPGVDIAVCSRVKDYEALRSRLDLNAAIQLAPLTDAQITGYLAGPEHKGTLDLIDNEATANEMARRPYLLTTMKSAYEGIPYTGSPHHQLTQDDESERQRHLFEKYVDAHLREHPHEKYTRQDTLRYLRWLAWQMVQHKTTVFYIEDLQPDWAAHTRRYSLLAVLVLGLVLGLVGLLVGGLYERLFVGLVLGLVVWLVVWLDVGLSDIEFAERITWSLNPDVLVGLLIFGLFVGLVLGLVLGLLGVVLGLFELLVLGLVLGLFELLVVGLDNGLRSETDIHSRHRPNSGLVRSLQSGLFVGLVSGLFELLVVGLGVGLFGGLGVGLGIGLVVGLVGGLVGGLVRGWRPVILHLALRIVLGQERVIPRGRYDTFLDYAASAGLLRKVGGGYIFRHRYLLEYVASKYKRDT